MKSSKYRIINAVSILIMLIVILILNSYTSNIKPIVDLSKGWTIQDGNSGFIDDFRYNSEDKVGTEKYITLSKSFIVPEENKHTDLWIRLGNMAGSYKLYVNDVFLGQSGNMPPKYRDGWANLGFYILPDKVIEKDKENTIRLEYYSDHSSGFVAKPVIITYEDFEKLHSISKFINYNVYIIIMTLLCAISLFFFYIYRSSIKEKYIMYFSLITTSLFIYYFGYVWTSPLINNSIILKITESAFFIAIILLIYFVKSYLGLSINRFDRYLHYAQMIIVSFSLLIPKLSIYNQFRRIFYMIVIFDLVYFIYIAARAVALKIPNSKYIFIIAVTALIFIVHDSIAFIIPSIQRYISTFDFSISIFILPAIIINLGLSFAFKIEELQNSTVQYSEKLKNLNYMLKDIIDENNVLYSKTITDHLTGTYNRSFLEISYKKQMEDMKEEDSYALFFLDIDNFRDFNNNYGHEVGDFVLISFVNIINEILDPIDIFVRYSGDEFVILMYNNEPFKYKNAAEKIVYKLQNSKFQYKQKNYRISCSIGIKLIKNNTLSLENALKFADMAMYRAKANGKSSYHILE